LRLPADVYFEKPALPIKRPLLKKSPLRSGRGDGIDSLIA
jgi:hypothetical protein